MCRCKASKDCIAVNVQWMALFAVAVLRFTLNIIMIWDDDAEPDFSNNWCLYIILLGLPHKYQILHLCINTNATQRAHTHTIHIETKSTYPHPWGMPKERFGQRTICGCKQVDWAKGLRLVATDCVWIGDRIEEFLFEVQHKFCNKPRTFPPPRQGNTAQFTTFPHVIHIETVMQTQFKHKHMHTHIHLEHKQNHKDVQTQSRAPPLPLGITHINPGWGEKDAFILCCTNRHRQCVPKGMPTT